MMSERGTKYRGYKIEAEHDNHNLRVRIHPTRPELPILSQHSFRAPRQPEGEALTEAKRRIDRVLSS